MINAQVAAQSQCQCNARLGVLHLSKYIPLSLSSLSRQLDGCAGVDDTEKERRRRALLERAEALQSQRADLDSELAELAAEAAAVISDAEREQLRKVLGDIGGTADEVGR